MSLLILHELLCLAMIATVFSRAYKTDDRVRIDVRLAFWLLGLLSCYGISAPMAYDFRPDGYTVAAEMVFLSVQSVTSYHWRAGVPECLMKPEYVCRSRRASDVVEA